MPLPILDTDTRSDPLNPDWFIWITCPKYSILIGYGLYRPPFTTYVKYEEPVSLCFMTLIKDMISSLKIKLFKASFLVYLIAIDYSEVIYDTKEHINPF